jgi:probable rRNA maturation factor
VRGDRAAPAPRSRAASITLGGARASVKLLPPLRALVRSTLEREQRRPGEIAIVLEDDAVLRDLNRRWRGIDRATDVISFAYDEGRDGRSAADANPHDRTPAERRRTTAPIVNGDLVVSLDRVRAQAKRFRVTEGEELARLVIHGVLHLAGFDHQRAGERKAMRAREDAALSAARVVVRDLERRLTPR